MVFKLQFKIVEMFLSFLLEEQKQNKQKEKMFNKIKKEIIFIEMSKELKSDIEILKLESGIGVLNELKSDIEFSSDLADNQQWETEANSNKTGEKCENVLDSMYALVLALTDDQQRETECEEE